MVPNYFNVLANHFLLLPLVWYCAGTNTVGLLFIIINTIGLSSAPTCTSVVRWSTLVSVSFVHHSADKIDGWVAEDRLINTPKTSTRSTFFTRQVHYTLLLLLLLNLYKFMKGMQAKIHKEEEEERLQCHLVMECFVKCIRNPAELIK